MSSSTLGIQFQGISGLSNYWTNIPSMIMGINGDGALSTQTGVPLGTPSEEILAKVGGGVKKADDFSGQTPATTSGMSQGGTAAS
jgi:NADH:ubiquinone oxidoreductase subunit F (NADH-binding)